MGELGSIGDFLPEQNMRCEVQGCNNLRSHVVDEEVQSLRQHDKELPRYICDDCLERYRQLSAQEVECAAKDCNRTWTWTPYQQLKSERKGFSSPPALFCEKCKKRLESVESRELECRLEECHNTWLWRPEKQLAWQGEELPQKLCDECEKRLGQLKDKEVKCKVSGCNSSWRWKRFSQLVHEKSGKSLDEPPARMCEECYSLYNELEDKDIPCKVEECEETWRFSRFAQLESIKKHGRETPPPQRMCRRCVDFLRTAHPVWKRCKIHGCTNTWKYSRGQQLQDHIAGRTEAFEKMCEECQKELETLAEKEKPCSVPGCSNTWTYAPMEQLRDKKRKRIEPVERRCQECEHFLAETKTAELKCESCGEDVEWTAYQQLLYQKGKFAKPQLCVNCRQKDLPDSGTSKINREILDHHQVVQIPRKGRWMNDRKIAGWPEHFNNSVIEKVEKADVRIVAFGDNLTYSNDDPQKHWPQLLENMLNKKLADEGLEVAVVNAGIPDTGSGQAIKRIERDVSPFTPHVVLFSFAFGVCYANGSREGHADGKDIEKAKEDFERLCNVLKRENSKLMFWTPNPIFPEDADPIDLDSDDSRWGEKKKAIEKQLVRHAVHVCENKNIGVLDLESMFEVNGRKSAKKWMCSWFLHNETGAHNIATWMADHLINNELAEFRAV